MLWELYSLINIDCSVSFVFGWQHKGNMDLYTGGCMCVSVCLWMCVFLGLRDWYWAIPFLTRFVGPRRFSPAAASANTQTNTQLIFTQAYLSSVSHVDESTHGLEGTSATGQEVGAVVWLQEANEVGTFCLQNRHTDRLKPCISKEKSSICFCFMVGQLQVTLGIWWVVV